MKLFSLKTSFLFILGSALLSVMTSYAQSQNTTDELNKSAPEHHQIQITGFEFMPKNLMVKAGDTVTWVNKDIVPHNVYSSIEKKAISLDLATGVSFSYTIPTFKASDTLGYFCNFHPSMMGKLSQKKE